MMCWREKERQWQRQWQFFNDFRLSAQSHRERERETERKRVEGGRERGGRGGEREIVHMYAWLWVHCLHACMCTVFTHAWFFYWFFISLFRFTQTNKYIREKLTLCCGGAVVYPAADCLQRHSVSDAHATWTRCAEWMGGCALLHSRWNSVSAVRHSTAFSSVF